MRLRSISLLIGSLFIRALEQGERTFTAMNARGYDGEIRTLNELSRPSVCALIGIAFFDAILILVVFMTLHLWSM